MTTLFTRIIDGDLPGRFVHRDDVCVAFLTINPITTGHTLVVPRVEVDHWLDLDDDVIAHLHVVAARVGRAIDRAFTPTRVATIVAGFEVPHVHVHVLGADTMADLDFARADQDPDAEELDRVAETLAVLLDEGDAAGGHGARG